MILTPPTADLPYAIVTPDDEKSVTQLDEARIIDAYKTYGALFFRGFDVSLSDFKAFTEQFCTSFVFNESPDRLVIDRQKNIQSVNLGPDAFPLHPELSREPWKPDVCFFWCLQPPTNGGETTICDGVEIVRNLPTSVRQALEGRRLLYMQAMAPAVTEYWLGSETPDDEKIANPPARCPYRFRKSPNGNIVRYFSRPAIHKPMFTDEPAFGNFILFARYLLGLPRFPLFEDGTPIPDELVAEIKKVSDSLTVPIDWRAGDLVMLDNTRFMHGRNRILNTGERQIASQFGYLKFAIPDAEEPADPFWRHEIFAPPVPKQHSALRPSR